MSKTKTGSNAQFISTGFGLSTVNSKCYAYSGIISVGNSEVTQLLFQTGKNVIKAVIIFNSMATDRQYKHNVYFNNILVQTFLSHPSGGRRNNVLTVIVPPLTEVKCSSLNASDTADRDQIVSFTGEVYG